MANTISLEPRVASKAGARCAPYKLDPYGEGNIDILHAAGSCVFCRSDLQVATLVRGNSDPRLMVLRKSY